MDSAAGVQKFSGFDEPGGLRHSVGMAEIE
jgi:hypothetical protein